MSSFAIERGEIFGFVGSNGCGKTTTMKMLTGLLPAERRRGACCSASRSTRATCDARRRVGYMSQSFSLYTELTVRQNLDLHARLFHLPARRGAGAHRRVWSTVSASTTISISWPPICRSASASACRWRSRIVHEPELLILDEPTSGVDPLARDEFWELLIDLSRNQGVTIFVSTHFMNEAARCDRISLMDAGPRARHRHAGRTDRGARRRNAGRGLHQLSRGGRRGRAPSQPSRRPSGTAASPRRAPAPRRASFSLRRLIAYTIREMLDCCAIRSGWASRCSAPRC